MAILVFGVNHRTAPIDVREQVALDAGQLPSALAGALIHEPRLLILDEPLTGLDAAAARSVKDMLLEQVAAGGTVILTTHILEVAERIAQRIGIIRAGRLVAEGSMAELSAGRAEGTTLEQLFLELAQEDVPA